MCKDNNQNTPSKLEMLVGKIADKDKPLVLRALIGIAYILAIGLAVGFACDNLSLPDIWKWAMTVWTGLGM